VSITIIPSWYCPQPVEIRISKLGHNNYGFPASRFPSLSQGIAKRYLRKWVRVVYDSVVSRSVVTSLRDKIESH